MSTGDHNRIVQLMADKGMDRPTRLLVLSQIAGRQITTTLDLTDVEARRIRHDMEQRVTA